MSFATNGNGHHAGDGAGTLRAEDYAPIWPMVPGTRKIAVTINGREVEAEEGQTILQACRVLGIEVPTLCYEPKLAPYGACRICVVEVEGQENTPISCGTQIREGMVITTHSDRLIEDRRMVLELIFSDHDAYCLPPCQFKCPTRVDIPGYLKQNTLGNWEEATRILKRSLPFPAILGRVCPAPCEDHCRREEVDTAIAIRDSHRYCADRVLEVDAPAPIPWPKDPDTGRRVAVIGAGPAGLAVAYYLQLRGHHCDVYEADPEQGGMLRYGIPEYRLPKGWMDRELDHVWELGATFKPNMRLGRDFHLADLLNDGYDAVYVGIGCYKSNELGIPGEDADGVVNALENLYNSTRGLPIPALKGARVVVIGGGFTAIDCTRTSVRQGAAEVTLVYRRDLKDMPAQDEVHEAIEEGARVIFQAAPVRIVTDARNRVTGVEFQRMKLGEPDDKGRRRPEPMPGTEFVVECDTVLGAIGQGPELSWVDSEPGEIRSQLEVSRRGTVVSEEDIFRTGVPRVFASGDVRTGATTVVEAIGEGRRASYAMDYWLRGHDLDDPQVRRIVSEPKPNFLTIVPFTDDVKEPKAVMGKKGAEERRSNFEEYEYGYTHDQAMAEAARCLQCTCEAIGHCDLREAAIEYETTLNMAIDERSIQDNPYVGVNHGYGRDETHSFILRDYSRCIDCGRCAQVCKDIVGAGCYDFIGKGFDSLVTTADFVSLNETPCVSCGRCAETCPVGALMPRPRTLETYQLDISRCIFCGICADACPYDALRCGPEFEFSDYQRDLPMLDILEMSDRERPTR
jgi:NADPH-dependent glutamate synthase beta subunit-like oxidoreductase/formate hydrogenlyase subunit 6/NADH:ubiquinone oxidoreductase subunit I/ferredoxin